MGRDDFQMDWATSRQVAAMKRLSCSLAALVLLTVSCHSALDGGSRAAFFVREALTPPKADLATGCAWSPSLPALSSGTMDVGVTQKYTVALSVQSTVGGPGAHITGAHVVVHDPQGNKLSEFDTVTTGFVDGNGVAAINVEAVDSAAAQRCAPELANRGARKAVLSDVTLKGTDATTGESLSAPTFSFPIDTCNGCLVAFPSESEDPTLPLPNCFAPIPASGTAATSLAVPCAIGQDQAVDCRLCGGLDACNPVKIR
jgi:hypothetical protein